MKITFPIPLLDRKIHAILKTTEIRKNFHYGIGNRCHDAKYLVFLDYDDTPLEWIHQEIKLVQDHTLLGTAYIFKTKHGHHVIFLEKFYFDDMITILGMTTIDQRYRNVPMRYGHKVWILRNSRKKDETIKYMGYLYKESPLIKSSPHAKYLVDILGIPKEHLEQGDEKYDPYTELILGYYKIPNER